jgi:hypothetical protein
MRRREQRRPGALWGHVGGDGPLSAACGVNPAPGIYAYVLDRIPVPQAAPGRGDIGLMIEQGRRTIRTPLTPAEARMVAGWLLACADQAAERGDGTPAAAPEPDGTSRPALRLAWPPRDAAT